MSPERHTTTREWKFNKNNYALQGLIPVFPHWMPLIISYLTLWALQADKSLVRKHCFCEPNELPISVTSSIVVHSTKESPYRFLDSTKFLIQPKNTVMFHISMLLQKFNYYVSYFILLLYSVFALKNMYRYYNRNISDGFTSCSIAYLHG